MNNLQFSLGTDVQTIRDSFKTSISVVLVTLLSDCFRWVLWGFKTDEQFWLFTKNKPNKPITLYVSGS